MGTLELKWGPNGDPKTEKGPHGDRVPQMGTHLGAVPLSRSPGKDDQAPAPSQLAKLDEHFCRHREV